ncbi:MAG: hypothetical protein AAB470_00200 [Patescibacteria group bacterium]
MESYLKENPHHRAPFIIILICIVTVSLVYTIAVIWGPSDRLSTSTKLTSENSIEVQMAEKLRNSQPASAADLNSMRAELSNAKPATSADLKKMADQLKQVETNI